MKRKANLDAIYNASQTLFQMRGYDNVSVDEICAKADISKPTFYSYDLTKPDLLLHAYANEMFDPVRQGIPDGASALQTVESMSDQLIDPIFAKGRNLLRDALRVLVAEAKIDSFFNWSWTGAFRKHLEEAKCAREIASTEDPQVLSRLISCYLLGYVFQYSISQADESRNNLYEGIRVILRQQEIA